MLNFHDYYQSNIFEKDLPNEGFILFHALKRKKVEINLKTVWNQNLTFLRDFFKRLFHFYRNGLSTFILIFLIKVTL
jgi:hypothetical protein